jgi:hypothetical protein
MAQTPFGEQTIFTSSPDQDSHPVPIRRFQAVSIMRFQEATMSVLQITKVYQKADYKHPAFRSVMNGDVSEVIAKQVLVGVLTVFTLIAIITLVMHMTLI